MNNNYEEVSKILSYDPNTGILHRLGDPCSQSRNLEGYLRVMVNRKPYLQHRVAFLLMEGRWPSEVDHINGNRADNRWSNLREVTRSQNNLNRKSRNITKRPHGWWEVRVSKDRVTYQEKYKCFGQAVKAAKRMREEVKGEYNHEQ